MMEVDPKKETVIDKKEEDVGSEHDDREDSKEDNADGNILKRKCISSVLIMEVDQKKETVIDKKEEDVGNEHDDSEDYKEANADGNILKRKRISSVLKDDFLIPTKVMNSEVGSLFGHQNENGAEAHGSHFHRNKNIAKVEADQAEVEANQLVSNPSEVDSTVQGNPTADSLCHDDDDTVLNDTLPSKLSSSNDDIIDDCRFVLQSIVDTTLHQTVQNIKSDENFEVEADQAEEDANQLVSYTSEVDSTVLGNPTADSLCPDDDDTLPSELSSLNDDIIDDCRSVLQSIVDTTLHQTVQNIKSDENLDGTSDTTEQPPIKKIKLALPSDLRTSKNSFSNSPGSGPVCPEEMESSSNPSEVDTVCSTVQGNPTADSLCQDDDNTVLNDALPSELSSSNDDIIDALPSDLQTSKNSFTNSLVPGLLCKEGIESSNNNMPHLVDTSTADVKQLPVSETTNIKACSIKATVLCDDLSLGLSSEKESENGDGVLQGASTDSTGVSTSTPDVMADEDKDSTTVMEPAGVSSTLLKTSNVRENDNLTSNDDLSGEVCPPTSSQDVELGEDVLNITSKDESNAYSSILIQDLYLDDSVECSEQSEAIKSDFHCNKEDVRLPSSADVEVVRSEDVYVDAIEPSLREDIMPSPGSSGDDFTCTFQKASQVLASSQDEMTCWHESRKCDDLSPEDLDLMTTEDLQVTPFVSVRQETVDEVVVGDWKALPDEDDSMLKVPEIPEEGHPDIGQEPQINLQYDDSKAKESPMEDSEHQFLQVLGLSPKQKMNKCEEQRESCHSAALPTCKMDTEFKDIEAKEEYDPCIPLLHPISGYLGCSLIENSRRLNSTSKVGIVAEMNRAELLYGNLECSPIEGSEMESSSSLETAAELSRDEVKVNNDQTVPSLQTPVQDNPCIDQLLELEESIFTEQDAKLQDGPMKQSIPVLEEAPYIEDEEDKPIPDHLQTLGQPAAGVFLWNHSLADPSLTPSLTPDCQSNLQHAAENLNQTPPITPVRSLPVCQRKRRVGLSRRQLVYPLHARTFSRK
ncbi:uncharacterized protein LOC115922699 [Strongylocentrotus purpuratus]|uniref:Uncharacterized protein n=1 Tax=Strongylocentrotus purpuratus TaxID=7668 RepID=A0A7M7NQ86_STRPU|nr:uncharacterized protein LOC115922699 [Strongylocentrotus purpuratus]